MGGSVVSKYERSLASRSRRANLRAPRGRPARADRRRGADAPSVVVWKAWMPGLNSSRSSRYSPSQRHQTVGSPPARGGGCARRGARTGDAAGLCAVADVEHADGADVGAVRVVQERAHLVLRQPEVEELEQEAERRRRALVEAALLRPAVRPRLDVRHLLVDEVHDLVEGLEDVEALEVLALRDLRVEVVVEVKDVGVRAADLEDRALDADLRHVLREPVAVDARPDGHAELARVREAHFGPARGALSASALARRLRGAVYRRRLAAAVAVDQINRSARH